MDGRGAGERGEVEIPGRGLAGGAGIVEEEMEVKRSAKEVAGPCNRKQPQSRPVETGGEGGRSGERRRRRRGLIEIRGGGGRRAEARRRGWKRGRRAILGQHVFVRIEKKGVWGGDYKKSQILRGQTVCVGICTRTKTGSAFSLNSEKQPVL